MLNEYRITEDGIKEVDKVQEAIRRLQSFEPKEGYILAFSGGKDSVVIKKLAEMSGVKFEAHYNVTSVDPPELVRFIKGMDDVSFDIPHDKAGGVVNMWNLIARNKMPPTRSVRYCCAELKESSHKGRLVITGVRWAESVRRKKNRHLVDVCHYDKTKRIVMNDDNDDARRMVEQCYRTQKTIVNPIIDWTDDDVWEFIHKYNVPYCKLYDEGWTRLGCIGCPMQSNPRQQLDQYPKFKRAYIRAFDRMIANGRSRTWQTGQEVYNWWVNHDSRGQTLENRTYLFDDRNKDF